ncbi:hypothetical protein GLOTRDRAFT_111043, partial [Gloeophyllum trabeum ATCC 11539]
HGQPDASQRTSTINVFLCHHDASPAIVLYLSLSNEHALCCSPRSFNSVSILSRLGIHLRPLCGARSRVWAALLPCNALPPHYPINVSFLLHRSTITRSSDYILLNVYISASRIQFS